MTFNHICFMTSDVEKSKKLWCDLFGFHVLTERVIPDGDGPDSYFNQQTLDDIFHVENSKSVCVVLQNEKGTSIELEQSLNPAPTQTPKEETQYLTTGVHEVAMTVTNIDEWFEKVKAAGYELQTPYIWHSKGFHIRSFLFFDHDNNLIQLVEYV